MFDEKSRVADIWSVIRMEEKKKIPIVILSNQQKSNNANPVVNDATNSFDTSIYKSLAQEDLIEK